MKLTAKDIVELAVVGILVGVVANLLIGCSPVAVGDDDRDDKHFEPRHDAVFRVVKVRSGSDVCHVLINEAGLALHMQCLDRR
jgi:hypothetical protein